MGDVFPGKKEAGQNQQFSSLAKEPVMLTGKVCFLNHHCETTSSIKFCLIKIPSVSSPVCKEFSFFICLYHFAYVEIQDNTLF